MLLLYGSLREAQGLSVLQREALSGGWQASQAVHVHAPHSPSGRIATNPDMAKQMRYRSEHEHTPGIVTDIFDGSRYRNLCARKIHINGTVFARDILRIFETLLSVCQPMALLP